MKQFFNVLKFELRTMLQKKAYIVTTLIIMIAAFVVLSIPRFSALFEGMGKSSKDAVIEVFDQSGSLQNKELVKDVFEDYKIVYASSREEMKKNIESGKSEFGFDVINPTKYVYYVNNSSMYDMNTTLFEKVLSTQYQETQLESKGYDAGEINAIYTTPIESESKILGKDGMTNYFYTYFFVIILYMMIMLYGNQIGVGVASEKSNRAIEILTTSCSSNALIFGKVMAGAIAGFVQTALMIGSCLLAYQINADAWDHMLDKFFNIPMEVILTFAVFGVFGYLLFSFLYGAIGALVSKTEEVNTASMPIQMIIMACFFIAFISMQNPDSMMLKVASFIPFSSWICMFIRVAMGSASMVEIVISAVILIATTIATGLVGAKLYRRGTLSYGNSVKFKNILKMIKQKD